MTKTCSRCPVTWRCHRCGETFTAWAAAEKHADETGHVRLEVVW